MHAEHPPSAPLRAWVESFRTRPAFAAAAPVTQRVLPDGCADVIFDLTNGRALAVGTMTTPVPFLLARETGAP
jgi:hypothetical protein